MTKAGFDSDVRLSVDDDQERITCPVQVLDSLFLWLDELTIADRSTHMGIDSHITK